MVDIIGISGLLFVKYTDAGVLVFKDARLIYSFRQLGDSSLDYRGSAAFCSFDAKQEGNSVRVLVSIGEEFTKVVKGEIMFGRREVWEIKAFLD